MFFYRQLPNFFETLDDTFNAFRVVYIIGDIHDNSTAVLAFLKAKRIIQEDITSLENVYEFNRKDVLLVFLGDIIGKAKHIPIYKQTNVLLFAIKHRNQCLCILGNHEIKFMLSDKSDIYFNIPGGDCMTNHMRTFNYIYVRSYQNYSIVYPKLNGHDLKILERHYSMRPKRWTASSYMTTLKTIFQHLDALNLNIESDRYLLIQYYILYFLLLSYCAIVYSKYNIIMMHAGMHTKKGKIQKLRDVVSIKGRWYDSFSYLTNTTFIFGHNAKLCFQNKPFINKDSERNNNYICVDTNCHVSNIISCVRILPKVNRFSPKSPKTTEKIVRTKENVTIFICTIQN